MNFCSAHTNSELRSRVATFLLFGLEVPVANIEPAAEYSDLVFHGFSQFIEAMLGESLQFEQEI
jgi:hypothetical protein